MRRLTKKEREVREWVQSLTTAEINEVLCRLIDEYPERLKAAIRGESTTKSKRTKKALARLSA